MYAFTNAHGCNISSMIVKQWNCIPGGLYPLQQSPPLCSNRLIPSHFKVTNRSIHNNSAFFLTLHPSSAFETRQGVKLEKYRFIVERFDCDSMPSFDIIVFPLQENEPDYFHLLFFLLFFLPLFVAFLFGKRLQK